MPLSRLLDEAVARCQELLHQPSRPPSAPRTLQTSTLEERILLNAAPIDAAPADTTSSSEASAPPSTTLEVPALSGDELADLIAAATEQAQQADDTERPDDLAPEQDTLAPATTPPEQTVVRRELVFVDMGIDGASDLLSDLWAINDDSRDLEVVLIKANEDGLAKITQTLADQDEPVDAIHILSHGRDGEVILGQSRLNAETLERRAEELASWSDALTNQADILFYGCDLAESDHGRALLQSIADITGADLAASTDTTGAAELGGDWVLEYRLGVQDVQTLAAPSLRNILAPPVAVADEYVVDNTFGLTVSASQGVLANDTVGVGATVTLVQAPTLADTFTLNPDGSFSYSTSVNNPTDTFQYQVTDTDGTSNTVTVTLRIQQTTGGLVGAPETAATPSNFVPTELTSAGGTAVATFSDGRAVVGFAADSGGGDFDVNVRFVNADGTLDGAPFAVSAGITAETDVSVSVFDGVDAASQRVLVSWTAGPSIQYVLLDGTGAIVFGPRTADASPGETHSDSATVALTSGRYLIVRSVDNPFGSATSNSQITFDTLGFPGSDSTNVLVSNEDVALTQTRPAVIATNDGGFAIAWQVESGATESVWYRKYSATGVPETAALQLASHTLNIENVSLAQGTDGNILVTYATVNTSSALRTVVIQPDSTSVESTELQRLVFGGVTDYRAVALADGTYAGIYTNNEDAYILRLDANGDEIVAGERANTILHGAQSNTHIAATPTGAHLIWHGIGEDNRDTVQVRTLTGVGGGPTQYNISGNVSEDVDGDGTLVDGANLANVTVRLWLDDGDGVIDSGDTLQDTTQTNAAGAYSFANLDNDDYYVTFDSRTVTPTAGFNLGFAQADVWATQTVFDENAVTFNVPGNATALHPNQSDDATSLLTSNHVVAVTVAGSDVAAVDAGFSFAAIDRTRDGDDDLANSRSIQGSLRQFFQNSNAIAGVQTTQFRVTIGDTNYSDVTGVATFIPTSALPFLSDQVGLDATTQAGYVGSPVVAVDGRGQSSGNIFEVVGDSSVVRGWSLYGGVNDGLVLRGDDIVVQRNYIGVEPMGISAVAAPAGGSGVVVLGDRAQIGGHVSDGNVISGHVGHGVEIRNSVDTTVEGNFIGVASDGATALGNGLAGVSVEDSTGTSVGRAVAGHGNVISANGQSGVSLTNAEGTTTVAANLIGVDITDSIDLGNGQHGIIVSGGTGQVTIGGDTVDARNAISGNTLDGIHISARTSLVFVFGNHIGLSYAGTTAIANDGNGITLSEASFVTIGGNTEEQNVISGNSGHGIFVGLDSTNVTIVGNIIGLSADESVALANGLSGVRLDDDANQIIIGSRNDGNIIAGNTVAGIHVARASNVNIRGNFIGQASDGLTAFDNTNGILVSDATGPVLIGGASSSHGNRIVGHSEAGIYVNGTTTPVTILRNILGLAGDDMTELANHVGIRVDAATDVTIGDVGRANTIAASTTHGIAVSNMVVGVLTIAGNHIGINSAGTTARGNRDDGIHIIGSDAAIAVRDNMIAGNDGDGVQVSLSSQVTLTNNIVGLAVDGQTVLANSGDGIALINSSDITVGGTGLGNVLSGNAGDGLRVMNSSDVTVVGNTIGLSSDEQTAAGNTGHGVRITGSSSVQIGSLGVGNLVGNNTAGVYISNGANNIDVVANTFGTDSTRTSNYANTLGAVRVDNNAMNVTIGGTTAGLGNHVEHSTPIAFGVFEHAGNNPQGVSILGNTVGASVTEVIEIDSTILPGGQNTNDNLDVDDGPNGAQNHPTLLTATQQLGGTRITGTLSSELDTDYRIEIFASSASAAAGGRSAERFLGFVNVTTDRRGGDVSFSVDSLAALSGEAITLTATNLATGATSELSNRLLVSGAPVVDLDSLSPGAGSVATYTENDPATVLFPNATVTGIDPSITSASVMLADIDGADEVLSADTTGTTITAFWNAGTSTLELTGSASQADYQAVLRTVRYAHSSIAPTEGSRTLTVTVSDTTSSAVVTGAVTVTAVNDALTLNVPPAQTVMEDVVLTISTGSGNAVSVVDNDAPVNTVYTTRVDVSNATVSFAQTSGLSFTTGDGINDSTLVFTGTQADINAALDGMSFRPNANFVGTATFQIEVDDGVDTVTESFAVTVTGANDAPTIVVSNTTVSENVPVGTLVTTAAVTDPDAGDTHTFSLTSDAGGHFTIDANTGEIRTALPIDGELFSRYFIDVRVTDAGGAFDDRSVEITVANVNEAPTLNVPLFNVAENAPAGTLTGNASASDVDVGDTLTYSLINDAGGRFAIDANTGALTTTTPLDHEAAASHAVTIRVTDAGGLFDERTVNISVANVNEGPSVAVGNAAVNESVAAGTAVTTATATDPDVGDSLTFALDDNAGGRFAVDAVTGVIRVNAPLDHSTDPSHTLTVRVTDAGGLFDTQTVTITVIDDGNASNVAPTLTVPPLTVAESVPIGTPVATVTATDANVGDTLTFSLADDAGGRLTINPTTGVLTTTGAFDFETAATHDVVVRVTDAGGLFDEQTVVLTVTNVNEPPTLAVPPLTIAENAPVGSLLGTATSTDVDAGDTRLYSLVDDAGGRFVIDANTGTITTTTPLDYETSATHTLTVQVTDAGGLSDTVTTQVTVTDANDATTVLTAGPYTTPENTPITLSGMAVLDADVNESLTAQLRVLTGDVTLSQETLTGTASEMTSELATIIATPTAETFGLAMIDLTITDSDGRVVTETFTLDVTAVNDTPVATGETFSMRSHEELVLSLSDLLANDVDLDADTLTFELVTAPTVGTLTFTGDTLRYTVPNNFSGAATFTYRVSDGTAVSNTVSATINVERFVTPPGGGPGTTPTGPGVPSSTDPAPDADQQSTDSGTNDSSPTTSDSSNPMTESGQDAPAVDDMSATSDTPAEQAVVTPAAVIASAVPVVATTPDVSVTPEPTVGPEAFFVSMTDSKVQFGAQDAQDADDQDHNARSVRRLAGMTGSAIDKAHRAAHAFSEQALAKIPQLALEQPALFERFDEAKEQILELERSQRLKAGTAVVTGTAFTIGYAVWVARGGYLLASVMSAMPTWRLMDPILVLKDINITTVESTDDVSLNQLVSGDGT